MFFLVQVDKNNLPRYLFLLLLAFAPLFHGGVSRFPVMVIEILIITIFFIFWLSALSRQPKIPSSVFDIFLFLFLIITFSSYFFAHYRHDALRSLLLIGAYITLYYMILFNFSRSNLRGPLRVLILSAVLQGIIGLFQYRFLGMNRVAGTFVNANFYAGFLVAILPLSLGEFLFRRKNPLWYFSNIIILAGIVLSCSRGVTLVLVVTVFFLLYFFQKKKIILCFLLLILAGLIFPNPLKKRIYTVGKTDVYAYSRLSIWKSALSMVQDHWKSGIGLGQYRYLSTAYSFPVEKAWARYSRVAAYAHNEYFQVGAELGLLGFLLVLAAIVFFWYDAGRQIQFQRFLKRENKKAQFFLLAGILAILLHALVDFNLHIPSITLLLITFAAFFRILNERINKKKQEYICFNNRKIYRIPIIVVLLGCLIACVRPYIGFRFYQKTNPSGEVTQNIRLLKKALKTDFLCAPYHNSLGGAYFARYGQSRNIIWLLKGVEHAELAAQLNPFDYRFPRSLGDGYYNIYRSILKDHAYLDNAKQEFLKALQLAPYDYRLYDRLASVEFLRGDIKKAQEYMVEALQLEPNYLKGHYQLALIKQKLGDTEGSAEEYNKIKEIRKLHLEKKVSSEYEAELIDFDYAFIERDSTDREAI